MHPTRILGNRVMHNSACGIPIYCRAHSCKLAAIILARELLCVLQLIYHFRERGCSIMEFNQGHLWIRLMVVNNYDPKSPT
jgi:hypothetical protein